MYKIGADQHTISISPVFTSVYWAKPPSDQKQWKLKGNKLGSFPLFTLSCHCLNEKPHWDVTSFCKQHYIEWPSESQCPTENPLSNWDKLFLKRLIIVWFRDLYTLPLQRKEKKNIHNIKTELAWISPPGSFSKEHDCRRYQMCCPAITSYFSITEYCLHHWSDLSLTYGLHWLQKNRWDGGPIYLLNHSTCLTIFFHF